MGVRSISMQEFDSLHSARAVVRSHTETVVEWFSDHTGTVLGVIACHCLDFDWSVLILARDQQSGEFRRVRRYSGIDTLNDARDLLVDRMAIVLPNGSASNATVEPDAEERGENDSPPAAA
jgi:hypothetical protein